jgi:hypothetical protein
VHFTREPIVETIITPKEGYKLAIRGSKGTGEEHLVNAVEVVSIGNLYFLRSLEKPKAFLLPFSDYEVLEVREVKMALNSAVLDKSIKIVGSQKPQTDDKKEEDRPQKKQRPRRSKKKEKQEDRHIEGRKEVEKIKTEEKVEERERKKLVPPPTTLISETISRYKNILLSSEEKPEQKQEPTEAADS